MRKLRFLLLAAIPAAAWSQAMVEYGLGAAAAGSAGAGGVGRGMSGIFNSLSKTLGTATEGQTGAASTTQSTRTATSKAKAGAAQPSATALPAEPPKPAVVYEDPAGITTGMGWGELLSRFGEPAMKVTSGAASESLTYETKERSVDVEMRGGKVYSLKVKNRSRQSAVVYVK